MAEGKGGVGWHAVVTGVAAAWVRLSGLAREVAFAGFFGANAQTDAYNAAFRAAQIFRDLVAEGALSNAYVPIFAGTAEKEGLAGAWRLANALMGVLLMVLGTITLLTFFFAEGWIQLVASGFSDDPAKFDLAVLLTRVMSPFVAFVSLSSVFMGMLNVRGRFFLPAFAPSLLNVAVILGCIFGSTYEEWTGQPAIVAVGWATLVGGCLQFGVQLPALYKDGYKFRPHLKLHPDLRRMGAFVVPAVLITLTVQFNLLVESQLASRFGDGPVSYLFYGFRLVQLPASVVAVSVATAALVEASMAAARSDTPGVRNAIAQAFTLNSFLVMPAAAGMFLLAGPLVELAFERGAFGPDDTAATAGVVQMYATATWGLCAHRVLFPFYYAVGQPNFPMKVAIGLMVAKLPIALLIVYPLGFGYIGLPLSHAVLVTAETALLWWGLRMRVGAMPRQVWTDHARILVATAAMTGLLWVLRPWANHLMVLPVIGVSAGFYFVVSHIVGLPQARQVLGRFFRSRPKGLPPTVEESTQSALLALSNANVEQVEISGGVLVVTVAGGAVRVHALGGVLHADVEGAPTPGSATVQAVMRIGQGPPMLHGLIINGQAFQAEGDAVVAGKAAGPTLPVGG